MVGGTTAGNVSFVGSFAGSPGFTAGPFGAGAFSTTQNAVIPLLVSSDVAEIHAIINQSGAGATSFDAKMSSVPEPSTLLLLGAGLVGVGIFRRRFKR